MGNFNRVPQRQIKSTRDEFVDFEKQMDHVESRTRHISSMYYQVKTQWDQGELTNIDTDALLDRITLSEASAGVYETEGTFISYVMDTGATDVKFEKLTHTHSKPAGTSVLYYTRSGNIDVPDTSWTDWVIINSENEIGSLNGRYIQFKVVLTTANASVSPNVSSVAIGIWGSAGLQEIYNARGPYKTITERFDQLSSVYILKVLPANGSNQVTIPKVVSDTGVLKVWVNGSFQTEGSAAYDAYTTGISGLNTIVTFSDTFDGNDVVVCRIDGAGAGVLTVKENVIVDEIPTTSDYINYTLVREPITGKEEIYVEGIKMSEGIGNDYTLNGKIITFNYTVNSSFTVKCTYYYL